MSKEQAELRRWLEEVTDPELSAELLSIRNEEKEVHERFYRSLEFGTGGLRGELGAGTNRMNIYTVRQATQGFAAYLLTQDEKPSAAISYDSRHKSDVFARETARVLAANGIKVYLYPHLMPTPALSFAVLDRHCTGGVMVTASHNPARYNGYKAYAADGAQISGHVAAAVSEEIEKTDIFRDVKLADFEEALADGRIEYIGDALIERYYAAVMAQALRPELGKAAGLRLVYTPLNGSGLVPVMTVLKRMGHTDITVVPEQEQPNGDFPTCPYPNPEILEAMQLGLNLCEKLGADLLLATDPDSDRVGTAVLQNGTPRLISGNEMGVLLLDYICRTRLELHKMPKNPVAVRSIVSTTMTDAIAAHYGVEMRQVLTGFKYIGEQIAHLEAEGHPERFIFGFEESYGYLAGGYVRDKDAVVASMLICEMAAWYKGQGKNLGEALDDLYAQYGFYFNKVDSYTFPGSDGMAKMAALMETLRTELPIAIASRPVTGHTDYEAGKRYEDGEGETPTGLPTSNVMEFRLGKEGSLVARPSGTEPKLKFYYSLRAADRPTAEKAYGEIKASVEDWLGL
uniref:phospho-sugar mutase n=1 Tax=Angelakisella sp. TaxID=1935177 RepID=UPI0040255751